VIKGSKLILVKTILVIQFNKIVPNIFSGLSLLKLEGDVTSFRELPAGRSDKWKTTERSGE
jgi:hypothetical protein